MSELSVTMFALTKSRAYHLVSALKKGTLEMSCSENYNTSIILIVCLSAGLTRKLYIGLDWSLPMDQSSMMVWIQMESPDFFFCNSHRHN